MGVTAELCARIEAAQYVDLPPEALTVARRLVQDGVAIGVAGVAEEQVIPIMARVMRDLGGAPAATVIGCGMRTDPVRAAALNGAAIHVLDFEPMWSPATHAVSVTLPVALALAESRNLSGRDVLTALVKGIELQGWLREASGEYTFDTLKFHLPGLVGPMGAVVAASHLLRLNSVQIANALGIAASRAGSLWSNVGTMTKSTHCGHAAAMGLEAALLAEAGFTGDPETFESPQGYANSFHPRTFRPEALLNFGRSPWRVVSPGCAIKMFPSQFGTHFAITAALDLEARISDPAAIRTVKLTAPVMPYVNRPFPRTGLSGKFSLQYTTASALLDGMVGIHTFTDQRLRATDMQALLPKITVVMDETIEARFEAMYVVINVTLNDGRELEARCNGPAGAWGQPRIEAETYHGKLRDCLRTRLTPNATEQCIGLSGSIDTLASISELMDLVA
jgi:aconitate decarboxylase